jgi:hypothetical protein
MTIIRPGNIEDEQKMNFVQRENEHAAQVLDGPQNALGPGAPRRGGGGRA